MKARHAIEDEEDEAVEHTDDEETEPAPPEAPPEARRRERRGEQWGDSGWEITTLKRGEMIIGIGGRCKMHKDEGCDLECKKQVTIGESGLSLETLRLRMKRWLLAGIDDSDWDADALRTTHVNMGGIYLSDFAEGLSEEACDRIANALE